MSIIINEFEVVASTPPPAAGATPAPPSAAAGPRAIDIEHVMRRHHERELRVRAD